MVVLVGALLYYAEWSGDALWFVPLMFFVVRPLAVWLGLLGSHTDDVREGFIAWFGIRGIGSVYYLMFAANHGLPDTVAYKILSLTLITIAASSFRSRRVGHAVYELVPRKSGVTQNVLTRARADLRRLYINPTPRAPQTSSTAFSLLLISCFSSPRQTL